MNTRSARVIQVVEVVSYEEEGDSASENIGRLVKSYYSMDGELLAVDDPVRPYVGADLPGAARHGIVAPRGWT